MLFLVIFWFQLFWSPCAFSWSKPPIKSSPEPPIESDYDLSPGDEQDNTLQLSYDALERYTRRPDCFRRVAGAIRTRCGELDMDEDERINGTGAIKSIKVSHGFLLSCHFYDPLRNCNREALFPTARMSPVLTRRKRSTRSTHAKRMRRCTLKKCSILVKLFWLFARNSPTLFRISEMERYRSGTRYLQERDD